MSFVTNLVKLTSACCFVCVLAPTSSIAATSYYLQLDGVDGESTSKDHPKWIEVNGFNWSITATNSSATGSGSGKSKPIFSDFSWTQQLDKSITGLFNNISTGKVMKTAVLDLTTVGAKPTTFFKMTFENAFLTDVSLSGNAGDNFVNSSFSYDKVTLDYWVINPNGSKGAQSTSSYDLVKGTGSISAISTLFAIGLLGPSDVSPVPEPQSNALMLLGLVAVVWRFKSLSGK